MMCFLLVPEYFLFSTVLIFALSFSQVPVIKKTWEKDALFLEYYSDHADPSIPTIDIGVPNTERGKKPLRLFLSFFIDLYIYICKDCRVSKQLCSAERNIANRNYRFDTLRND